jgi:hypothetical protein
MYQMTRGQAGEMGISNRITGEHVLTVQTWGGWHWTHEGREYKTSREGEGLFIRLQDGTWSQCQGTGQFSLPQDRQAALRQLRRAGLAPALEVTNAR